MALPTELSNGHVQPVDDKAEEDTGGKHSDLPIAPSHGNQLMN